EQKDRDYETARSVARAFQYSECEARTQTRAHQRGRKNESSEYEEYGFVSKERVGSTGFHNPRHGEQDYCKKACDRQRYASPQPHHHAEQKYCDCVLALNCKTLGRRHCKEQ